MVSCTIVTLKAKADRTKNTIRNKNEREIY